MKGDRGAAWARDSHSSNQCPALIRRLVRLGLESPPQVDREPESSSPSRPAQQLRLLSRCYYFRLSSVISQSPPLPNPDPQIHHISLSDYFSILRRHHWSARDHQRKDPLAGHSTGLPSATSPHITSQKTAVEWDSFDQQSQSCLEYFL